MMRSFPLAGETNTSSHGSLYLPVDAQFFKVLNQVNLTGILDGKIVVIHRLIIIRFMPRVKMNFLVLHVQS